MLLNLFYQQIYGFFCIANLIKILLVIVPLLISVAYFTLAERKILGAIQRRRGPNVVGIYGLTQPLSDGFKLLIKETVIPSSADTAMFIASPIITFVISLIGWGVIPFDKYSVILDMNIGFLYIFAVSSLGVYGIILSGWSSNSKYAFLGALRSAAQMVSYEVSIGFIIINIAICVGSFNLQLIVQFQEDLWFIIAMFPLFIAFFASSLAETNRHPFDLPEAEAELVSGYNVEYSAMGFALFSLGEYANMLLMCALNVILFFGGWLPPLKILSFIPGWFWFSVKIVFFVFLFVWIRAALPRYRYDQLMALGWKNFLPISLSYLVFTIGFLSSFGSLYYDETNQNLYESIKRFDAQAILPIPHALQLPQWVIDWQLQIKQILTLHPIIIENYFYECKNLWVFEQTQANHCRFIEKAFYECRNLWELEQAQAHRCIIIEKEFHECINSLELEAGAQKTSTNIFKNVKK